MHSKMKQIKHHSMRMKEGRNDRRRRMSLLKKLQEKRKIAMEFSDRRKRSPYSEAESLLVFS